MSLAPGKMWPETLKAPVELKASKTLVPSEYNIFLPLSAVPQVTPVPELVLKVTVCDPVVAFSTI